MLDVDAAYARAVAALCDPAPQWAHRVICAYHANVDTVSTLDPKLLGAIIDHEAPRPVSEFAQHDNPFADGRAVESLPSTLQSRGDVLRAILSCFGSGCGGEWRLGSNELVEWVQRQFPGEDSLGGTSAIVANHLAGLGLVPVLHAPTHGPRLMQLIDPRVRFALNGTLVGPSARIDPSSVDPPHLVLQFAAGSTLRLGMRTIVSPASNRIILARDDAALRLPIDPHFSRWLESGTGDIDAGIWCGYNLLDPAVLAERIERLELDLNSAVGRCSDPIHHFEASDARNDEVRRVMYDRVLRGRASVGVNAEEFTALLAHYRITAPPSVNSEAQGEALAQLAQRLDAETLILHGERYAIGASRRLEGDRMAAALAAGCLVGAARALNGGFVTAEEVRRIARRHRYRTDPLRKPVLQRGEYRVALLPTVDIGAARCSIGLGDSFVAGLTAFHVRGKQTR